MPKHDDDWLDESTNPISVALVPMSMEQQPCQLQMLTGPGAPKTYELYQDELVIGRAIEADIPVIANDLSRRHVAVRKTGPGQWSVVDLESRNGVYLNGVKVHSALLHDGDNIQLGTVVFVFIEGRRGQSAGGP